MSLSKPPDTETVGLPLQLLEVLAVQPANVDRRTGAELITRHFFPVSHRTLEVWPIPTRHINGRVIVPTAMLFAHAFSRLSTAPLIMGGRRSNVPKIVQ
jgi:hypothetical protein